MEIGKKEEGREEGVEAAEEGKNRGTWEEERPRGEEEGRKGGRVGRVTRHWSHFPTDEGRLTGFRRVLRPHFQSLVQPVPPPPPHPQPLPLS